MVLHISVSYKTGPQAKKEAKEISDTYYISEDSDATKNYFVETHLKDGKKSYFTQAGIVKFADDECIIVSSNTKSRGIDYNPWEDEFNEDVGYINYYGDNKRANVDPSTTRGNKYLLKQFKIVMIQIRKFELLQFRLSFLKRKKWEKEFFMAME